LDDLDPIYNLSTSYSYWDETQFQFPSNASSDYQNPFSFTEDDVIQDGKWIDSYQQFMSNATKKISIQEDSFHDSTGINLYRWSVEPIQKSYERFLYLAAKYPSNRENGFIQPTYAVIRSFHQRIHS
jgi:hypothetical protein